MDTQTIRKKYLEFFVSRGHKIIPRANLVPQNDPSTLFTGSGMQPMVPYLLGETHPQGTRIADSQTCFRVQDIEEVGDYRHYTFFEMLGNWSLGDYFKREQIEWIFGFLTDEVGLDPKRLYVSCYIGNEALHIPRDDEAAALWVNLFKTKGIDHKTVELGSEASAYESGMQGARIFFYDGKKNWWNRANGNELATAIGDPCGPDSEMFYELPSVKHDTSYGEHCHPNCDCGRFIEIGNNVFMTYRRTERGFEQLPKPNVDCGMGLERLATAANDDPDAFKISLMWPVVQKLEQISGKPYVSNTAPMRVITDHLRAATFLAVDGVVPSNKLQGYVMRRLLRRAIRYAFDLGIEQNFLQEIVPVIADLYHNDFPEVAQNRDSVVDVLMREEKIFRQTLRKGIHEFGKLAKDGLSGEVIFKLYDTYGFPVELTKEEAFKQGIEVSSSADEEFDKLMAKQRARSQTAAKGTFKGGLADHSDIVTKYHTATHLMYRALKNVLGNHVVQRGSNTTAERTRFDFSHPAKMTPEQITEVEKIVNEQIKKDWPVSWREESTKEALAAGVSGAFGDKYGERVKVYTIGDPDGVFFSREICGGPHVSNTAQIGESGKKFKIVKEESSSAGVRRIKAVLA